MHPQIKLINKLTYKLRLTPQMRLSLNLLQLPLVKLKEFIAQQIAENPLLDIENVETPMKSEEKFEDNREFEIDSKPIREEFSNYEESLITTPPTLGEYLLGQLRLSTDYIYERKIGELIIGNIDNNGYLRSSIEDIAESAKTDVDRVEKVLFLIQSFEPIGVGARNLRECLLIQLKGRGEENSLAGEIVDKYLSCLEKKRFDYIAKKLKIPVETIKEAVKEIVKLEPKPGHAINTEKTRYISPDVILRKDNQAGYSRRYKVIFNDGELPRLKLSKNYQNMLKRKNISPEAKEYLKERLKAAQSLINAVNKRKDTIQKVTENIIHIQKDFIDKGIDNLKPMTLEQVAKRVKKHKSTVSRAVTNKYLQTPWGIYELCSFLNSGIKQNNGEIISSKTVKSKIKELIENENKNNPLSDQKIVKYLNQKGISLSRRTVTKYRKQLGIFCSQSRRE